MLPSIREPHNRPQPPGGGSRWLPARVSRAIIALALVAGAALLASAPALAAPAATGPAVALKKITIPAKTTLAYWTPAHMRAATPAPLIESAGGPTPRPVHPGTRGHVPGGQPAIKSTVRKPAPEIPAGFPYNSFNVPASDYTQWPYELNGKVFITFNIPGGTNPLHQECSGTSVASYHGSRLEDEVWTAGHCIANPDGKHPGVWASSVLFVPAYNGTAKVTDPFGEFVATSLATVNLWLNNTDASVEEGAFEVGTNSSGQTLGQAVGWDGFAWNWPAQQTFTAFGYPAVAPYPGDLMVEDIANTGGTSAWPGGAGQPLIGIGNPMTAGSSGGAWNISLSGAGPYIDGHNGVQYSGQSNVMYSPYQDSLTNAVRCFGQHNAAAAC